MEEAPEESSNFAHANGMNECLWSNSANIKGKHVINQCLLTYCPHDSN
jgi:hypothetical protein